MNIKGTKKKNQVVTANIFEQQELLKKAEVIKENLGTLTVVYKKTPLRHCKA